MISLPNLLKFYKKHNNIQKYSFNEYFEEAKSLKTKKIDEVEEESQIDTDLEEDVVAPPSSGDSKSEVEEENVPKKDSLARIRSEAYLAQAKKEADQIIAAAQQEAENIRLSAKEAGYHEGYQTGYDEGYAKSIADVKDTAEKRCSEYLEEIKAIIEEVSPLKDEILKKYKTDLKNIAIAIGEKVIQVSLKSSGSVIEKMIISATEKLKAREWAKIYISKFDADLMLEGDNDLLKAISRLSDNLKVIAMENEKPGTCIIELPDEIIDASASTQVENIKEILNSTGI
ncbi:MAG: hypothetical protein KHZ62_00810 [Clostridiales bacterium]|nr:hypothetical protein [Clostridiales bacterium]